VHWSTERAARIDPLPDALVVSLDRLPSHGRSVAEWMVEAKKRRSVPVLFAGGTADKAEVARRQFPHAAFCATSDLVTALARLLAERRTSAAPGRRVPGPPTRPTPRKPGR
jgi:hypothetical protein